MSFYATGPYRTVAFLRHFLTNTLKEVKKIMTFNLFFLTISVMKKERTIEEIQHEQTVNKMYEEMKDRQITMFYTNN